MAQRVFVTGATGTIGSALVPILLDSPETLITILLRARDDEEMNRRVETMCAYWGFGLDDSRRSRLIPIRGDVSLPQLGLESETYGRITESTTHVVHCAASVKLNMSMEEAVRTAVVPTRGVLELARAAATHGLLQKVELVSTVGVWGRSPGLMPERRLSEVQNFHNTYEAAKAEAERVVWAMDKGLPITVHRPSMVVGEAVSGRVIHFQVFYHLCEFLAGTRTFGVMPHLGTMRLDTIPVDWVAKAICWSMHSPTMAGRILHLCSGPSASIGLCDLQRRVRETWRASGRSLPRLWHLNSDLLARLVPLIGAVAGAKARRALRGLPPVLAYLAEDQAFSNNETSSLLSAAGLPVPLPSDYLGSVLGYYLADVNAGRGQ
jgi:thioester reductase-like protein